MSTSSKAEARDIAESKQEALRALLNSLVPNGQMALPKDTDIEKLAEKLDELLVSKGGLLGAQSNIPRDDQGRPLNEEGLPIMEIMEPINNDAPGSSLPSSSFASSSLSTSDQAPLSPLPNWALSSEALAARRRERDRILDLLEQEEAEELAREAASVPAAQRKPSDAAIKTPPRTLDQIVHPPALVSNPSAPILADSNLSKPPVSVTDSNRPSVVVGATVPGTGASRKPKKQKSVSFVDPPPNDSSHQSNPTDPALDWGDVIPVQLNSRAPGPTKTQGIMKDFVVERVRPVAPGVVLPDRIDDSDDEDETADVIDDMPEEEDSETEVPVESLRASGASDEESDEEDRKRATDDVDETDFDDAMLQREIALAYYARRNQIGPDVTSGPLFDSTSTGGTSNAYEDADGADMADQEPNTTRFRQSRLGKNPQALINSAVQFGKLVDGQLVAEEAADEEVDASLNALAGGAPDDEEDMTEKMIELLMRGEIPFNAGNTGSIPKGTSPNPRHDPAPPLVSKTKSSGGTPSSSQATPSQPATTPKPKLNSATLPTTKHALPHQSAPPAQTPPPMVIESGFGFDPAFQVAPKPTNVPKKSIAPMSETVKERVSPVTSTIDAGRAQRKSRFAQAIQSQPSAQSPNPGPSSAKGRDVVEPVTPKPAGKAPAPEPPKRMSRFRAERAGYL